MQSQLTDLQSIKQTERDAPRMFFSLSSSISISLSLSLSLSLCHSYSVIRNQLEQTKELLQREQQNTKSLQNSIEKLQAKLDAEQNQKEKLLTSHFSVSKVFFSLSTLEFFFFFYYYFSFLSILIEKTILLKRTDHTVLSTHLE